MTGKRKLGEKQDLSFGGLNGSKAGFCPSISLSFSFLLLFHQCHLLVYTFKDNFIKKDQKGETLGNLQQNW
jgi:hypothetical protein